MLSERRRIQLAKSRDRRRTHTRIGVIEPCDDRGRVRSERRRIQLAKSRDRRPTHTRIGVVEPCDDRGRVLSERRRIQLAKSRDRRPTHIRIGVNEPCDDRGRLQLGSSGTEKILELLTLCWAFSTHAKHSNRSPLKHLFTLLF